MARNAASSDRRRRLNSAPALVTECMARRDECFLAERIDAGADPTAVASGGMRNDRGSTASDLAHWTTGRGGSGRAAAKDEQRIIIELLEAASG